MTLKRVPEYRHPSGTVFCNVWLLSIRGRVVLVSKDLGEVISILELSCNQ